MPEKKLSELKHLKVGSYVLIDDVPCVVDSIQISKAGKHGAAKARIVAKGVFDNTRKDVVAPGGTKMDVPIIEKKTAQVIAFIGNNVQLMDMQDFSTFEVAKPDDVNIKEGDEVIMWEYGSYRAIKSKK